MFATGQRPWSATQITGAREWAAWASIGPNVDPTLALEAVWTDDGLSFIAWGAPNSEEWPRIVGNPF